MIARLLIPRGEVFDRGDDVSGGSNCANQFVAIEVEATMRGGKRISWGDDPQLIWSTKILDERPVFPEPVGGVFRNQRCPRRHLVQGPMLDQFRKCLSFRAKA